MSRKVLRDRSRKVLRWWSRLVLRLIVPSRKMRKSFRYVLCVTGGVGIRGIVCLFHFQIFHADDRDLRSPHEVRVQRAKWVRPAGALSPRQARQLRRRCRTVTVRAIANSGEQDHVESSLETLLCSHPEDESWQIKRSLMVLIHKRTT